MVTKSKVEKENDQSNVKTKPKLNKDTIRDLSAEEKKKIKGGGFIMKDTIIIRTSG